MDKNERLDRCFRYMREFGEEALKFYGLSAPWIIGQGLHYDRECMEVRMHLRLLMPDNTEVLVTRNDAPLFFEVEEDDRTNIQRTVRALGLDPVDVETRMERVNLLKNK